MSGHKKQYHLTQAFLASSLLMMPMLAFSDQTYPPDANTTQQTSVVGNITVQSNGQIKVAGADAVQMDKASTVVVVEANNQNPDAINSTTNIGINITAAGSNSLIVNNVGSEIIGATQGIQINATTAQISNSGDINSSAGQAIDISATGVNATIQNNEGANIVGVGGQGILVAGTGLTLDNSGTISSDTFSGITFDTDFNTLTNNATGTIFTGAAGLAAIRIRTNPLSGEIINSGLIVHNGANVGAGYGIWIDEDFDGSITNNAGGTIRSESTAAGAAILIDGSFNEINNAGVIEGTDALGGDNEGIFSTGTFAGTINNTGIIRSVNAGIGASAIALSGGLTDIFNSGTITTNDVTSPAIAVTAGSFTGAITNTGEISNTSGGEAINLSAAGDVLLNQNGGTITGDVNLAGLTASQKVSLNMNGGTIIGDVFSSPTKASTVNLNGGTLNGNFNFLFPAAAGVENILNLDGTTVTGNIIGSTGDDIFNLSGGSFTKLDGNGTGTADVVNIVDSFTLPTASTITNVTDINVNNAGTVFTVNGNINNVTGDFTTDVSTSTILAPGANTVTVTGSLINNGTTTVTTGNVSFGAVDNNSRINTTTTGILTVATGNYDQTTAGASYGVQVQSPNVSGFIDVLLGNATLANTTTVNPSVVPGGFISEGSQFDILRAPVIADNSVLAQPPLALITFEKNTQACVFHPGNCIVLTAHLNSIEANALSDIAKSVATALDPQFLSGNITNPDLLNLFAQLQTLPSSTELNAALEQLAPPYNYANVALAHIAMDNAFDSAQLRLEWLKGVPPLSENGLYKKRDDEMFYNGVSYGDSGLSPSAFSKIDTNVFHNRGTYGGWVKLYGTYYEQMKRTVDSRNLTVDGYTGESTGYAVGADWAPSDFFVFGVAGSYAKVNSTDETAQQNTIDLESYMATFYSWYQVTPHFYVDTMIGIASHEYDMKRNINIGTISLTAQGQPYGFQYGGQIDIGYAFSADNSLVAPYVRGKYTNLKIGTYTEIGAGGLNLQVENEPVEETILGVGLRIAFLMNYVEALYVPEISATILYDFSDDALQSQSIFMGGTPPFYTDSIEPPAFMQIYSASLSAYTGDNYAFSVKFNFEHRDHFFAYNGYMQLNYSWG